MAPVNWEDSSWKHIFLVSDEEVISLSHAMGYLFSDYLLCLGKMNQNPTSNSVWEEKLELVQEFITIQNFGQLMVSRWNASEYFPRIHHIALLQQSP